MTAKINHVVDGLCQTTDSATAVPVCSFQIPNGMSCEIRGKVMGQYGTNSASATTELGLINNAGVATIVGTPTDTLPMNKGSSTALAKAAIGFTVTGDTVTMTVTGVKSTIINWLGSMEILGYIP